jgi:hypothetical protein
MLINRKFKLLLTMVLSGVFFFQGCSTIFQGTAQKIPVTCEPSGVKVVVDGKVMGNTPLILKLKKKKDHLIRLEKEGYEPVEIRVIRRGNFLLSLLGNYFLGGTLGTYAWARIADDWKSLYIGMFLGWGALFLVDVVSGANYSLTPGDLTFSMTRKEEYSQSRIMRVRIVVLPDTKWIKVICSD